MDIDITRLKQAEEAARTQNGVVQIQRAFSPTVVNETRFGVNRNPRVERDTGIFIESYSIPGITGLPTTESQSEIGTTFSAKKSIGKT